MRQTRIDFNHFGLKVGMFCLKSGIFLVFYPVKDEKFKIYVSSENRTLKSHILIWKPDSVEKNGRCSQQNFARVLQLVRKYARA